MARKLMCYTERKPSGKNNFSNNVKNLWILKLFYAYNNYGLLNLPIFCSTYNYLTMFNNINSGHLYLT